MARRRLSRSSSRRRAGAHEVRVVLPRAWAQKLFGHDGGHGENTYIAPDYDTLVDSPILAGSPSVHEFSVSGTPHYLVNFRERGVWNGPQRRSDLAKVAETIAQFWGSVPFDRFYFFNVVGLRLNGLEHKNSTVINIPRESTSSREGYLEWLSLAATNTSTRGTSNGCGPSSWDRSTTRTRSTPEPLVCEGDHRLLRRPVPLARRRRVARRISRRAVRRRSGRFRQLRGVSSNRSSWRPSMPGSSTTAPTRTRRTPRSATT